MRTARTTARWIRAGLVLTLASVAATAAQSTATPNRLAQSASPYLQQHANNPIDWYPWGEEAFERARAENKPVFLSIGYSTCYWCHVMARESFEDPLVADFLNDNYIAVKVDRERRPDVDEPYLLATYALTGRSGWPNNLLLTPDLNPFFATVYEPRDSLLSVLSRGAQLWDNQEQDLRGDGDRIMAHVMGLMNTRQAAQSIDAELLERAVSSILQSHDDTNGGFEAAPKFPRESWLMLLLHDAEKNGNTRALEAVARSVDGMLAGGIHDQLVGGFHRYAVDPNWQVPHFEKMLYTQALMARVLVRLFTLTGDTNYRDAARTTLDFALTHMRDPRGGFYSAFDAEDAGGEGHYYTWSREELDAALPDASKRALAFQYFGLDGAAKHNGRHVLRIATTADDLAREFEVQPGDVQNALIGIQRQLNTQRATREAPALDRKIVLDWNALMAIALAEAGNAFGAPLYRSAAQSALRFVANHLVDEDGELLRVYFDGTAELPAQQRDYALLGLAHLAVHDATGDPNSLASAQHIAQTMQARFHDETVGDYFMNSANSALPRFKSRDDSSFPSGNSMALALVSELATRTLDNAMRHHADTLTAALSGHVANNPLASSDALVTADRLQGGHHGAHQQLSQGRVRGQLHHRDGGMALTLSIAEGWHINASEPLQNFLTPTRVRWQSDADEPADDVPLPAAKLYQLDYSQSELLLHEGTLDITLPQPPNPDDAVLRVTLQACSNEICLNPTEAQFRILARPQQATDADTG